MCLKEESEKKEWNDMGIIKAELERKFLGLYAVCVLKLSIRDTDNDDQ